MNIYPAGGNLKKENINYAVELVHKIGEIFIGKNYSRNVEERNLISFSTTINR